MKEHYISSISKEKYINKIVDLFNHIYPICITLQAPLLSMKKTQSFNDEIDQHIFFTIKSDTQGIVIDEFDGFYFYDLVESINDFYSLNILFQAIKAIMDHCVRKLRLAINSSLNILINSFMDTWFLPVNITTELFEMCISEIPFSSIRQFNDQLIFVGVGGKVLLNIIYIQESGWTELLYYEKEIDPTFELYDFDRSNELLVN